MRSPWTGRAIGVAIVVVAAVVALWATNRGRPPAIRATLSLEQTLGGADTVGFERATAPRTFEFPADHGAHPTFRSEWWYLTGNLEAPDGRRFGYQLTLFRSGLAATMPARESDWATRQAYMAHFALTDAVAGRLIGAERFARGAQGLAGATFSPFRVWLHDWSIASIADRSAQPPAAAHDPRAIFPLRVEAANGNVGIDLLLRAGKSLVLNGEAGLSRKGEEEGNASWYYSFTRLPTSGIIRTASGEFPVAGTSWFDREWSTSALPEGATGWDWFGLQLADSTELMVYRFRQADGARDPSGGTWVGRDGVASILDADDIRIESLDEWTSPLDTTRYPARWRLRVPRLGLDLEVTPILPDQELNLSVRYWEGAVDVRGSSRGSPITGRGYVELTGYAASPLARRAGR